MPKRLTEPIKISRLLLVLILLSGGAVFQAEASLDSRLIDAAEAGEAAEVRKLLSTGASVNAHSPIGKTALMFAAQEGHLKVVEAQPIKAIPWGWMQQQKP